MRKLFIVFSLCCFHFSLLSAQTFQRGSLIISLDYGFDIYSTQLHEVDNNNLTFQNKTSGAASTNLNLGGEFGVTNWLGLGLQGKVDDYIRGKDSGGVASAYGFEIGAIVNFHIVRHLHFDLLAGLDLGYSNLTITSNDGYNDQVYGSGSWFDLHFTARVYIGKFGFGATLYFPIINYPNLTSNNAGFNEYVIASFKAHGEGVNLGIQYHFLR
jgi:hypothetical protein